MKVIFLDHDGVICLATEWGGRYKKRARNGIKANATAAEMAVDFRFDNFNKKAIQILNEILEKTGAEIIVSSDWKRWANVEEMGQYYEAQGIIKKPIAFTPDLSKCTVHGDNFIWSKEWDLEQIRSIEIKQYLHDHPEITHWVAIDDLDMSEGEAWKNWGLSNFVLTPRGREGIKQNNIKEKILEFLL